MRLLSITDKRLFNMYTGLTKEEEQDEKTQLNRPTCSRPLGLSYIYIICRTKHLAKKKNLDED